MTDKIDEITEQLKNLTPIELVTMGRRLGKGFTFFSSYSCAVLNRKYVSEMKEKR